MLASRIAGRRATAWPAALVVVAATVQEVGAAFAVGLFGALGVTGTVFARFAVAGVVLCGFRADPDGADALLVRIARSSRWR